MVEILFKSLVSAKFVMYYLCPKLRMHPAPEVHDLTLGCMDFAWILNIYYIHIRKFAQILGRVHGFGIHAPDVCIRKILNYGH